MSDQNLANHRRLITGYHYVLGTLILVTFVGAMYHLVTGWDGPTRYAVSLVVVTNVALFMTALYARVFALRAQDRVILLEENLRSERLKGEALDPRLTVRQIIGLRFASDDEWEALARRAADETLSEKDIKQAVKNWRPDDYRV